MCVCVYTVGVTKSGWKHILFVRFYILYNVLYTTYISYSFFFIFYFLLFYYYSHTFSSAGDAYSDAFGCREKIRSKTCVIKAVFSSRSPSFILITTCALLLLYIMCICILQTIVSDAGDIHTCDIRAYYYITFWQRWQRTSTSQKYEIIPWIAAYNCHFGKYFEKPQNRWVCSIRFRFLNILIVSA